ncbi:hypothetical protein SAMN02910340_02494 [Methanosarcina thermophila]|uniref:Uncharacterized protein n=3 Tax=Methanosarcina thermophila TaxID=2210 RepID=A0A0E3HA25_METTE|nr:hypothetical protein [Methanosarcina thermophila]AKB14244.1 hypothetical protein MSTHT_2486 [Methanosarcina thermophila TM-1]AKB15114.1 hypothetical protein MSTHC_0796 [Methanosarcina thermophila CHTI-55]SFT81371.1 hypothetical protein SAMN02910340_02494 [Methanosarcina thermophila]HOQ66315.1 hypothetical protein [Methanosarcina thermophila]HPT81561.1 hypothetical protein [Methanosarcina thermophila]
MTNQKNKDDFLEIIFPKLSHFWMDSGLLGLYKIAEKEDPSKLDVEMRLTDEGLTFKGNEDNLTALFNKSYKSLLDQYYNKSTEKQKQKKEGFYYDSKEDKFVRFPKVKAMGIAGLIFNKPPRMTAKQVKYDVIEVNEAGKKIKKKVLPPEYSHLQDRFDSFLSETGLKISSNNLLIDGPNAIRPQVDIKVKKGKEKGRCFICGEASHSLSEIGGTVYPMITGSSGVLSFNSNGGSPEKVCWKCDFLGKFVPVNGFYVYNNDSYNIYFPYSSSPIKMSEVYDSFQAEKIEDPNLLINFKNNLGFFFQHPFEQFFSFLYSLYLTFLRKTPTDGSEFELDLEKLFDVFILKAPLEFYIINTRALGDTQMGKMIWPFNDSVYLFRLFDKIEKKKINLKEVMENLIDYDQKKNDNKTLIRNKVCERILKKNSILELIEQYAFHINKSKKRYIKPIHDFVIEYEKILKEGNDKVDQEIIDTAVSLGKTIGFSVATAGRKGKGDLFRLRRTRKPEDFLNEINRIQIKYGALVTADLYGKGQEFENNFQEFKQFCMIAALNTFNAKSQN